MKDQVKIDSFYDLKNANELFDEFVQYLMDFDSMHNRNFETDIYLYVDENLIGTLSLFENPGGNSWKNDDHYLLYTDKPHYEDWSDYFQTIEEVADALGMSSDTLIYEILDSMNENLDEDSMYDESDVDFSDVYAYVSDNYDMEIENAVDSYIRESRSDYVDSADELIAKFDEDLSYSENY